MIQKKIVGLSEQFPINLGDGNAVKNGLTTRFKNSFILKQRLFDFLIHIWPIIVDFVAVNSERIQCKGRYRYILCFPHFMTRPLLWMLTLPLIIKPLFNLQFRLLININSKQIVTTSTSHWPKYTNSWKV